jgi:hypothetical protein
MTGPAAARTVDLGSKKPRLDIDNPKSIEIDVVARLSPRADRYSHYTTILIE